MYPFFFTSRRNDSVGKYSTSAMRNPAQRACPIPSRSGGGWIIGRNPRRKVRERRYFPRFPREKCDGIPAQTCADPSDNRCTKSLPPRGRWHGAAVTEGVCATQQLPLAKIHPVLPRPLRHLSHRERLGQKPPITCRKASISLARTARKFHGDMPGISLYNPPKLCYNIV